MVKDNLIHITILLILTSCNINRQDKKNEALNISSPAKPEVDMLIRDTVNLDNSKIVIGDPNNLDIFFGFRGLKLKTDIDSLSFSYSFKYDYTYQEKQIVILKKEYSNTLLFGDGDNLELIFFKNKLTQISIFNSQISPNISPRQFMTQLNDLVELFGNPTIVYPKVDNKFSMIVEKIESDQGLSNFELSVGWKARSVDMRFFRHWKEDIKEIPIKTESLRFEDSKIVISLIVDESYIRNSMNLINDSLRQIQIRNRKKEREIELKSRF